MALDVAAPSLTDPAFLALAGASALAGLVRGFSGFGSAMIFVPIVGALHTPTVAVVLLFLVDTAVSLPLLPPAVARCAWREVAPLGLGAALLVPVGVELLLWADPTTLRWTVSLLVLVFTALLASGWRRRGKASVPATFLIGAGAGLGGGLASLYGPPIVLFWLSGHQNAATVRANILAFFGLMTAVAAATYLMNGMITGVILATAVPLAPIYGGGILLGVLAFRWASEQAFRTAALLLCAAAALLGLPLWQGW